MKSLSFSASFDQTQGNPNGIDPRLACILTKYAGQSNKTNFLGEIRNASCFVNGVFFLIFTRRGC